MRGKYLAFVSLAFLYSGFVLGFEGRVISVHDGDTLSVLVDHQPVRIRLADIDAPELGQPFGRRSMESLKALCAAQQAELTPISKDRCRRTVTRVTCGETDAGSHQVLNGMAWVYDKYADPKSTP